MKGRLEWVATFRMLCLSLETWFWWQMKAGMALSQAILNVKPTKWKLWKASLRVGLYMQVDSNYSTYWKRHQSILWMVCINQSTKWHAKRLCQSFYSTISTKKSLKETGGQETSKQPSPASIHGVGTTSVSKAPVTLSSKASFTSLRRPSTFLTWIHQHGRHTTI